MSSLNAASDTLRSSIRSKDAASGNLNSKPNRFTTECFQESTYL